MLFALDRLRDIALEYAREIELLNRERKLNQVATAIDLPADNLFCLQHNACFYILCLCI